MVPISSGTHWYPMTDDPLSVTFSALADPTRRAILARLLEGEASVAELAAPFSMTPRAVSKHIGVLEAAGLVTRQRDAQRRPSRIRAEPLVDVDAWLESYRQLWLGRFGRLNARLVARRDAAREPREPQGGPSPAAQRKGEQHGLDQKPKKRSR
jgi:DNA-binding transcriptional ArsR family regulator